jgi:hypothetical protein
MKQNKNMENLFTSVGGAPVVEVRVNECLRVKEFGREPMWGDCCGCGLWDRPCRAYRNYRVGIGVMIARDVKRVFKSLRDKLKFNRA